MISKSGFTRFLFGVHGGTSIAGCFTHPVEISVQVGTPRKKKKLGCWDVTSRMFTNYSSVLE